MSRKGNCYDNSIIEIFLGRMRREMYFDQEKSYFSFEMLSKAVDEHMELLK